MSWNLNNKRILSIIFLFISTHFLEAGEWMTQWNLWSMSGCPLGRSWIRIESHCNAGEDISRHLSRHYRKEPNIWIGRCMIYEPLQQRFWQIWFSWCCPTNSSLTNIVFLNENIFKTPHIAEDWSSVLLLRYFITCYEPVMKTTLLL